MTAEDARKWLEYQRQGLKPTRTKLRTTIYCDQSIGKVVTFSVRSRTVVLTPIRREARQSGLVEGYMAAFTCELEFADPGSMGDRAEIQETLDRILPLLGFNYAIPHQIEKWEDYEGSWLPVLSPSMYGSMLNEHGDLPKANIHQIVAAYETLADKTDKRSKKSETIRLRLKEALALEEISRRYSFLSYYSILEVISDDLASSGDCPTESQVAKDIAKFSLSTKGSQRTKIYFLLNAMQNSFDIEAGISLAETRNEIAHGRQDVPPELFNLCKEMAFWSSEKLAILLASGA
jgi:hypothetical protein